MFSHFATLCMKGLKELRQYHEQIKSVTSKRLKIITIYSTIVESSSVILYNTKDEIIYSKGNHYFQ